MRFDLKSFQFVDDGRASDALAVAAHALHLTRTCWKAYLTISLPRMRPAAGGWQPRSEHFLPDREFVQTICALRLLLPHCGLVLSTREPPRLRDGLVRVGITSMSAGASTEPSPSVASMSPSSAPSARPSTASGTARCMIVSAFTSTIEFPIPRIASATTATTATGTPATSTSGRPKSASPIAKSRASRPRAASTRATKPPTSPPIPTAA